QAIAGTWIEKIDIESAPPRAAAPADGLDPLAELDRLIAEDVLGDEAYARRLEEIADELRGQLPPECRDLFGRDGEASRAVLAELAREGAQEVLARLRPLAASGAGD